jgi:hypothetical protein
MSTIGRIFTVLNVFLAAAFLGFAATNLGSHQSWKKKHDDLATSSKAKEDQLTAQLADTNAKLEAANGSLSTTDAKLGAANNEVTRLDLELGAQTKLANENGAKLGELNNLLGGYNQKLEEMNTAREAAARAATDATAAQHKAEDDRNVALAAQKTAEGERDTANKTIADLERDLNGEKQAHQQTQTELASLVASTGVTVKEIQSQPDVRGAVVQVRSDPAPGLVSINKGTADGVKRGMTFEIFEGSIYKGTVRVDSVRDNMCTGIIYRSVPGTTIAQGDSAATRI